MGTHFVQTTQRTMFLEGLGGTWGVGAWKRWAVEQKSFSFTNEKIRVGGFGHIKKNRKEQSLIGSTQQNNSTYCRASVGPGLPARSPHQPQALGLSRGEAARVTPVRDWARVLPSPSWRAQAAFVVVTPILRNTAFPTTAIIIV